jgi:cell wall-associated NlpC family hydrolase
MQRLFVVLGCILGLVAPTAALAGSVPSPPPLPQPPGSAQSSWAEPQIEVVVAAGLMASSPGEFRPDDPLTKGELADLLAALGGPPAAAPDPSLPVKLRELDAALVKVLGLGPQAAQVYRSLAAAGLKPPARAGTEVVARLLGLRLNHPQAQEGLELGPVDPVSRAETAFSVARVLQLREAGTAPSLVSNLSTLVVPELSDWQRQVLARAVRFIGFPYIWGGTSEKPQAPFGVTVPGGFDCSGFVWRVYKLQPFAGAPQLASTLHGRTTYVMSGEVPATERIGFDAIEPGDVLFFGDKGPNSKPSQVGHMGIYLGGGWFVHSGSHGVGVSPLEGWYATQFAWARRPLAEAGLA